MTSEFEGRIAAAKQGDETTFVELFRSVQPLLRFLTTLEGDADAVTPIDQTDGDQVGLWQRIAGEQPCLAARRCVVSDPARSRRRACCP